jgi:hypothetical protein
MEQPMKNTLINAETHELNQEELRKLPVNQCILFGADLARNVLHVFESGFPDDKRPRLALEMVESLKHDPKIVLGADDAAYTADANRDKDNWITYYYSTAAWAISYSARSLVRHNGNNKYYCVRKVVDWVLDTRRRDDCEFIQKLYNHAYNPNPFPNEWKTPDVLNISKAIIQERDFSSTPILADALTDAGCNDEILLNHLRNDIIGLSDWTLFSLRQDALWA